MSRKPFSIILIMVVCLLMNVHALFASADEDQNKSDRNHSSVKGTGTAGRIAKWRTVHQLTDSVMNEANGNIGINVVVPGEKFHLGDGNVLIEGGGETAIKFKEDATFVSAASGTSQNPIFELGRIIKAGDGDPEFRFIYHDDHNDERSVLEFDRKGIVASVKQERGSHFEGFMTSIDKQPVFRLNSFPQMRLEMGAGGDSLVDVAIQRNADATLAFITGDTERIRIDTTGKVGIGTTAPTEALDVNGNVRALGIITPSDGRLKTHVTQLINVLEKLEQVRGVSFEWKEATGRREIGVIAQELESVFPELVFHGQGENYLSVDYSRLTGVLIEGIKELRTEKENQINTLRQDIAFQNERLASLQQHNTELEKRLAALEQAISNKTR